MKNTKSAATATKVVENMPPTAPTQRVTVLVSPKGKEFSTNNLSAFARRFSLDSSTLSKVIRGQRQNCKGWTVARTYQSA